MRPLLPKSLSEEEREVVQHRLVSKEEREATPCPHHCLPEAEVILKISVDLTWKSDQSVPAPGPIGHWRRNAAFIEDRSGTVGRDDSANHRTCQKQKDEQRKKAAMAKKH